MNQSLMNLWGVVQEVESSLWVLPSFASFQNALVVQLGENEYWLTKSEELGFGVHT